MNRFAIAICLAIVGATSAAAQEWPNPTETNRDLYQRIHGVRGVLQLGNTFSTRLP